MRLFESQRDAFRRANESGTGQTRGLTLVTVDDVAPTSETEPAKLPEGTTDVAATTVTAEDAAKIETVVGELAPELQVNVQITFDFDSAALAADQKAKLSQVCSVMKQSDIKLFRIIGHTDASGTDSYNERLSKLRAEEVQRYFVNDCGIDAGRLEAMGLGERFLFDPEDPKASGNRRVEFQAMS